MSESKVAIGVMSAGEIRMETAESLIAAMATHAAKIVFFWQQGPYLDDGRNHLCRIFCYDVFEQHGCDRLLMVDSDIEFLPQDVTRLAELDLPIVSGTYFNAYDNIVRPVVYDWCENEVGLKTLAVIGGWPDSEDDPDYDPVTKVTSVGAGFLMIRRDALDTIGEIHGDPQPWFAEDVRDGIHFGEDHTFCLRAAEAGIDVCVDRSVNLAHHKHARIAKRP